MTAWAKRGQCKKTKSGKTTCTVVKKGFVARAVKACCGPELR